MQLLIKNLYVLLLIPLMLLLCCSCSFGTAKFDTNITKIRSEYKDFSYGEMLDYGIAISVYGTLTANVNCSKVRITCEVYSKYNQLICTPTGVFEIEKGQTIEFNIFARPQNSGDLDTPLHTSTSVTIIN